MNNALSAEPGETIYSFLLRAIEETKKMNIYVKATHNDTSVFVHPESCISDLSDKYYLQRLVDRVGIDYFKDN